MIDVKVRQTGLDILADLDVATDELRNRAMVRALNKTAEQVRTAASREIRRAGYNIPAATIKRQLKMGYASSGNLRATVTAGGKPIPLINYGARQTGKGVSVNVLRGRRIIAGAFIATMPSGHKGVYVREANAKHKKVMRGTKAEWHALPIRELFGPSVPDGLTNEAVRQSLQSLIVDKFPQVLRRESAWLMRSTKP